MRLDKDGYMLIKTEEPRKWELLHRVEWTKHNGPVPKGYKVIFKDGNKVNCDISNLMLISHSAHVIMNNQKRRSANPEITEAYVALSELEAVASKKRRKKEAVNKT